MSSEYDVAYVRRLSSSALPAHRRLASLGLWLHLLPFRMSQVLSRQLMLSTSETHEARPNGMRFAAVTYTFLCLQSEFAGDQHPASASGPHSRQAGT